MASIKCYECGSDLDVKNPSAEVNYNDDVIVSMEIVPCQKCIDEAYEDGKSDVTGEG